MALKPILRDNGLASLEELVSVLLAGERGNLADKVVEAILNQETSFFRDGTVLQQIVGAAAAMQQQAGDRRLRIWCAGCSTGQEPYSLAMLFAEWPEGRPMPEIVATDISAAAIDRARTGSYSQFEIQRGLPVRQMIRWFVEGGEQWSARPELKRLVQFRRNNLVEDPPPAGRFDIILCRNVLMYFPSALRRSTLDSLASVLRPQGLLIMGAGETVIGQTEALVPSERHRGMYRPDAAGAAASQVALTRLP
ncbi:CheR family methyltransferase [Stakelama saccharophila]|uniref:Protein-glutamate O-methyltransferase CheR n=1 Tax=Stakelama saccharophila TaxID=3075605 RepID=A0ABZ0B5W4_9SPHN|nr:protein-glutamate O-methyltransferase CheR [Stakelama sp. W311]WNO52768.1 protein-glutamate O-methyltransferase CheR [Stakelama sp. W311]